MKIKLEKNTRMWKWKNNDNYIIHFGTPHAVALEILTRLLLVKVWSKPWRAEIVYVAPGGDIEAKKNLQGTRPYPTWRKGKSSTQKCFGKGYVIVPSRVWSLKDGSKQIIFAMISFACVFSLSLCVLQLSPTKTNKTNRTLGLVLATCISWLHWHVHQFDARTSKELEETLLRCCKVAWRCFGCSSKSLQKQRWK